MTIQIKHLLLLAFVSMLAACGGSSNNNPQVPSMPVAPTATATPTTEPTPMPVSGIRIYHASPDAPAVDVRINGEVALSDVDYGLSSATLNVDPGTYSVQVDGILPSSRAAVIGPVDLTFENGMLYEILAVNSVAAIEPVVFARPASFDEEMVRVSVLHGAHAAPEVDVHVTAPGAMLSSATAIGSFAFKGLLGPLEIAAGSYQIRVTLADTETVVYDSGTLDLTAGLDVFAVAVANPSITDTSGKSPIALALSLNNAATTLLYSADNGADLRVVHNSADAPAVDVVVNDNFDARLFENLAFPDFTRPYVNVPAAEYNVKVVAASTTTDVIDANLTLANGGVYTVIALNVLNEIEPLVLPDNPRSVATEARVRVIHGSTLAGTVDVYVTAPDADITDIEPAVPGFIFKEATGYISLAAGTYDVTVTGEGSKEPALGPAEIQVAAGGVYTIIARDALNLTGVGLTLLDDFVMDAE